MSNQHGCHDDSDVIDSFTEALKQRVGDERFQIWFSGIRFHVERVADSTKTASEGDVVQQDAVDRDPSARDSSAHRPPATMVAMARGQFAADRLRKQYLQAMRGAASSAVGGDVRVRIDVEEIPARQVELPFQGDAKADAEAAIVDVPRADSAAANKAGGNGDAQPSPEKRVRPAAHDHADGARMRANGQQASLHELLTDSGTSRSPGRPVSGGPTRAASLADSVLGADLIPSESASIKQPTSGGRRDGRRSQPATVGVVVPEGTSDHRWENFVAGACNEMARAACRMAIERPTSASPLVLWGPPGCGKTHLLLSVASKLRGIHRMRRVVVLSAEEFTNDFIKSLNASCLPAFRSRFRDADALLIDDLQFFVEKKATIRELHHTIELLADAGKPLVFAGTRTPAEIRGLGGELSGRLASGLVCQVDPLDFETRLGLLSRYAEDRCPYPWPEATLCEVAQTAAGDGRLLSGIVNLVSLLQRMHGQMPSMEQIRHHGAHLLRSAGAPITLSSIERAVEKLFQLDSKSLQSGSQTKSVTEPRMLAMYLSRELTSSAFSEIGGHFGGRSHSTAILANQRVKQWIGAGRPIGRGPSALSAAEAVRRIESILKTG